jgi:cell division septal protein FtsQ
VQRSQATATSAYPNIAVPPEAQERRRFNQRELQVPYLILRQMVRSARWISLGILVLSVAGLVMIGQSEAFYLTTIPVAGARTIEPTAVVAESGLGGIHIFAADPARAAERIGAMPGIITATVTLKWPNEVMIAIGEDAPIAIWEQGGDEYWITEGGRLLPSRLATRGLLHIVSEDGGQAAQDELVPALVLDGALELKALRPNIESLYYSAGRGLSYQDGRGWRAYFGRGRDMAQKLAVYETIVEDLVARGIWPAYVSVSNQEKPFYGVSPE